MADQDLLTRGERGRTIVWLDGEHDIATTTRLTETLAEAVEGDDADVVIDLSGVTFMSAATVTVLISVRADLTEQARVLTLRSPSRCAIRVLSVCGLTQLIEPG